MHLTHTEMVSCGAFQLRNLRIVYLLPSQTSMSLQPQHKKLQDQASHNSKSAASSLAFNPSSGSILTAENLPQHTPVGGSLAFEPSSGDILTHGNTQQEARASSSTQSSEDLLQAGLGPSTSDAASHFTPRSESTRLIGKMLRSDLAAEMAAVSLFKGRSALSARNRPDIQYFKDREKALVTQLQSLMPTYRARPSLVGPVASAAGFALGAAASILPQKLSHAITGATQEALVEQYTDQLRDIREAGIADEAEEVREALRALRDEDRAPESTVKVPDIMSLQRPQDLTLEEGVAAVVKFGLGNLFNLAAKL